MKIKLIDKLLKKNKNPLVIFILGLIINLIFALFNITAALYYSSLWFFVFALYYFLLFLQKLLVLLVFNIMKLIFKNRITQLEKEKTKIYIANGAWFIPIAVILTIIVSFMIGKNTPTQKTTIMAIASATYAFTKIGIAIRNIIKARSSKDLIIQTIRNIGFVDALTSILVLEITLISTFGTLDFDMKCIIGISGFVIFLFTIALGIYMIINGIKKLKN